MTDASSVICRLLQGVAIRRLRGTSALVLAGLVVFAGLAASNAELHKLLHHNAGDPDISVSPPSLRTISLRRRMAKSRR